MFKDEIQSIYQDGLTKYTMKGGKLPPIELIHEGQTRIEEICRNSEHKENGVYGELRKPSDFYYNRDTRHLIYFDKNNGDLITGDKFRNSYFNRALINNNIEI